MSIARLLVRCFGPLRIDGADDRLLPRSRKARAILAYLVMSGGAGASRDRLSGLLWGSRGQEQARASVRQALTEIRSALGEQRILADRLTVRLATDSVETDLGRILEALRRDPDALAGALGGIEGELFADLDGIETELDHWLQAQRAGVSERIVTEALKLLEAADCQVSAGQRIATALQLLDSGNEAVARAGMRFDFAARDPGAARRRYQRLAEQLARDFDTKPSAETQAVLDRGIRAPSPPPATSAPVPRADPTPPMLIVAPFEVLGEDAETQLMARICADDILTVLGRFRDIVVSAAGEDGTDASAEAIAVYVLEASVRPQGGMVRANLRLRDRRSGRMLWSHQAELEPGRIAHDVDGIVARVVGAIAPTIAQDVGQSVTNGALPEAPVTLYMRARALVAAADSNYAEARTAADLLERALEQAPRDAQALLLLARIYNTDFLQTIVGHDHAALRERALDLAQRAAALDPLNSRARILLGWCMLRAQEAEAAMANFRAALLLNPYNADCVNAAGFGMVHLGELDEGETLLTKAIALNPVPHGDYFADLATLLMLRGEHREAERHFAMQVDGAFHYVGLRAANLGWLGTDATALVTGLRTRFARMWTGAEAPSDADIVAGLQSYLPFARAADRARLVEGLKRARLG